MTYATRLALAGILVLSAPSLGFAQDKPDPQEQAWQAAMEKSVAGPADVTLGDQATFHMSADMIFVPRDQGAQLMQSWGNSVGAGFHGLVFPKAQGQNWVITVDHTADGFVKDDDAKAWNTDDLLQALKAGTEAQNKDREAMGISALDIQGWVQTPKYDTAAHQLVWSLKATSRGAPAGEAATINYNTYALGRDGYFEINLLTDDKHIDQDKAFAHKVIQNVDYVSGKRYADFNPATDSVAEYGLAALVGGVVAKKLGLFALIGVFLAKYAKLLLLGSAVGGGAILRFFRRKSA